MHERKKKMEGEEGGSVVCSQADGAVCRAWCWALRTPGLSQLSGPGKNTHTDKNTYTHTLREDRTFHMFL